MAIYCINDDDTNENDTSNYLQGYIIIIIIASSVLYNCHSNIFWYSFVFYLTPQETFCQSSLNSDLASLLCQKYWMRKQSNSFMSKIVIKCLSSRTKLPQLSQNCQQET